ncbi:ChaN family lipoprotein [Neolewinella xylanilytica]|nr:ChaN family lipoprotein [Neolewinella xylanilytica]
MVKQLRTADVILFGEYHNNPISHWMQLEIMKALGSYGLGMEMFETDEQDALSKFMADSLTVEELDHYTGGVWPNFHTDYLPILLRARADSVDVVATNVPREYAQMVFQRGFIYLKTLKASDQLSLPPIPPPYDPELPGYKAMRMPNQANPHAGENFPKAQAIKDATMAWQIVNHARPGRPFLHINGSYHSDNYEGIVWYLRQYKPQLKVVTISTLEQRDMSDLREDSEGTADFILLVPENMTKTY